MSLQAVLMCGGLGTRLRPWSYIIPKPLFPIGERPILELLIDRLRRNGITEIQRHHRDLHFRRLQR